jgi:hypothetical protein
VREAEADSEGPDLLGEVREAEADSEGANLEREVGEVEVGLVGLAGAVEVVDSKGVDLVVADRKDR